MSIANILKESLEKGASDIILSANSHPCLKINGDVVYLDEYAIADKNSLNTDILSLMSEKQKELFKNNLELDFSVDLKDHARFRVNVFSEKKGLAAVFRPIKNTLPDAKSLGLPEKIFDFTNHKNGLVLVTGAVGSGKSTTLATLISHINKTQKRHIITVEDPIEFVFESDNSLIEQREVGSHTKSFDNGLKYALRQASDVIMIGEMRDLETFRLALRAAETGNLVFATLHTSGAARTVARIIDMFPAEEKEQIRSQLAESLVGVVWQDLLKTKDGKGRVLAHEVLVKNLGIENMIRKGLTHQIDGAMETGGQEGMITMDRCLEELEKKGLI